MTRTERALSAVGAAAFGAVPALAAAFLEWSVRAAAHYAGGAAQPLIPYVVLAVLTPHFVVSEERRATAAVASAFAVAFAAYGWHAGFSEPVGVFAAVFLAAGMGYAGATYSGTWTADTGGRAAFGGIGFLVGVVYGGCAYAAGPPFCAAATLIMLAVLWVFRAKPHARRVPPPP